MKRKLIKYYLVNGEHLHPMVLQIKGKVLATYTHGKLANYKVRVGKMTSNRVYKTGLKATGSAPLGYHTTFSAIIFFTESPFGQVHLPAFFVRKYIPSARHALTSAFHS